MARLQAISALASLAFFFLVPLHGVVSSHRMLEERRATRHRKDRLETCGYSSCNPVKEGMINVHLVPHSHDDLGWLITADQYYYRQVQYILDSVIQELAGDPVKRFNFVEVGMFARWFREQNDEKRQLAIDLLNQGRLEFSQSGWVTNDEAVTHYNADIDHQTYGFEFMRTNVGACGRARAGWQIDPFGHSREQASLFAQYGFDSLFFGRLDYQDKANRIKTKTMEFVWRGSPENLGPKADLFTSALFNEYIPPPGFCFDIFCNDPEIVDDPRLHDYNVNQRVDEFLQAVQKQADAYATNHLIMPMGSDYQYQAAHNWYKNLDKLIKYTNQRQQTNGTKVNLLYSTPSCYAYQVWLTNRTWTTKEDDFFPYAHRAHTFWTGYFTSRPTLKYYVRNANTFLQMVTQMDVLGQLNGTDGVTSNIEVLAEAMATAQHHDAITGTEKQVVAYDYAERLGNGINKCQSVVNKFLAKSLLKGSAAPPEQQFCPLLNISSCNATDTTKQFQVTAYNPVARPVEWNVRIPVNQNYTVSGPDGQTLPSQLVKVSEDTMRIPERQRATPYEVIFPVSLPPLGFNVYFLTPASTDKDFSRKASQSISAQRFLPDETVIVSGKYIALSFDSTSGLLKSMTNLEKNITIPLTQNYHYYVGHAGNNSTPDLQASGAYIFRPDGSGLHNFTKAELSVKSYISQGEVVQEVYQMFSPWVTQVIRVYNNQRFAQFQWTVGPIPIDDQKGKEVISRFNSDLTNKGVFYTDLNGREVMQRRLNHRDTWNFNQTEPVAGNYYPVCTRIYIRDESRNLQLTVVPDRSEGGSSIQDGAIELMVHRRLLHDDALGVDQALNETGSDGKGLVARGIHYVMLDHIDSAASVHRDIAQRINMAPQLSFTNFSGSYADWTSNFRTAWSGINTPLPPNVNLLTLRRFFVNGPVPSPGIQAYLLRLEHFYEKGEDPVLSQPATVSLQKLFSPFTVLSVDELTLGGNILLKDLKRLQWRTSSADSWYAAAVKPVYGDSFNVTLTPMGIRTFQITVGPPTQKKQ